MNYNKRIKIFIILIATLFLVCLLRLMQMQLMPDSSLRDKITELKRQKGLSRQLKTIRGKILDRAGRVLALDEPQFGLHISYSLCRFADERIRQAWLLRAASRANPEPASAKVQNELKVKLEDLQRIIQKCTYFGASRKDIEKRIKKINERMWKLRSVVAWVRNGPSADILKKYNNKINDIPFNEKIADFEKKFPDTEQRLLLVLKVDDIVEMKKSWKLLQLETDDDIFTAQFEFMDADGVEVVAKPHRSYPYRSAAAQTIGWVGRVQKEDKKLFADDKLLSYLDDGDELCGREDGVEYLCESILRGRRGEVFYDIDKNRTQLAKARFGQDVALTIDIELQKRIEKLLADCSLNPNYCTAPTAAVVIEVETGEILALASVPSFDLNRARYDYDALVNDPNKPMINRAINEQYPPGSVIKPVVLIAGLESGKITEDEVIPCPARKAKRGWPSCWIYNRYQIGHDDKWYDQGGNNSRNAIKGSCNIYFSKLAERIEPAVLQEWLFKFGYGQNILLPPAAIRQAKHNRTLRQLPGKISSANTNSTIAPGDRRFFGIGQSDFRVTPLQVANAMAVIARGGLYKPPRLFLDSQETSIEHLHSPKDSLRRTPDGGASSTALNISPETLEVIYAGMNAVVSEPDGTAYKPFAHTGFDEQGVKVYGKTGSTQLPENAWFAGFAEDRISRSVAIAVVVEGGQHGSSDAAPLARDIIGVCIEAGYIGQR